MKITAIKMEQPAVRIELTPIEAEILMDVMGNISGSGPRDVTSEIYYQLGKLVYESSCSSVIEYQGARWRSKGDIKWEKA